MTRSKFPLTEQEVHHRILTDPRAYMVAHILEELQHQCGPCTPEQMAAVIFFALDQSEKPLLDRDMRMWDGKLLNYDIVKALMKPNDD